MKTMNKTSLAYDEQEKDLAIRIAAHKNYASIKIENLIADFVCNKNRERVCDIGCGSGNYSSLLSKQAKIYVGVDINDELLRRARNTTIEASNNNSIFMKWDMNDSFPFVDQSFDLVFSAFSAYYVNDALQLVHRFHDLLNAAGNLCILGPAPGNAFELDQISRIVFGKSATNEKDARLNRIKNEFLPLTKKIFGGCVLKEFDISLVFPSVHEYSQYYMATPQFKELLTEGGAPDKSTVVGAVGKLSSLRLTKKVLLLGAERARV